MVTGPVKIFTHKRSPRLTYIADLILNEILGLQWQIINDRRKIGKCPVINYSNESIKGSFKISPAGILFEKGVTKQEIEISEWNGLPVFFTSSPDSDMPFDIFAASFYMITRYEEYLEFEPDEFGRFRASDSLAYRNGFLEKPVVDLWVRELAKALVRRYNTLSFRRHEFRAIVTVDIDEPFAYLGKNLIGDIGGFIHDLTEGRGAASQRFDCLVKGSKDPYDLIGYIEDTTSKYKAESRYFFFVGDHSVNDRNPSWKNQEYRNLVKSVSARANAGIHPSVRASDSMKQLNREAKRYFSVTGENVRRCRFHLLRTRMPVSYSNLSKSGITEDYSMGFPENPGFRAGFSRDFYFFDVSEDLLTNLRIIPFQIMDITLRDYKKLDPSLALGTIRKTASAVRDVGGIFVTIWHNTTLLDTPECRSWRDVFEFTAGEIRS